MKLSITLITSLFLSLSPILAQDLPYCEIQNVRIRKNLNQLSGDEWSRYVNAVKKINEGRRLTTWDTFIKQHVDNFSIAHSQLGGKSMFLPWHRLYLYYIEKELQKVDSTVTIPYWDWTLSHRNLRNDIAFSNRFFGGQSQGNNMCIVDGQFRDFRVGIVHGGQRGEFCLMRRNDIFNLQFSDPEGVDRGYISARNFKGFAMIEFGPHANVHISIGGQFSGNASPGDPLFYSHHAFIDKLWFDWQNRNPKAAVDYYLPLNDKIAPWNIPLRQVIDPFDRLCAVYKEEHFSWDSPRLASNTRASILVEDIKPESYVVPKNTTDLKALEEYDTKYINNGLIDVTTLKDTYNVTPIPKPLSLEFITMMDYDLAKVREQERRDAILLDSINRVRLFGQ